MKAALGAFHLAAQHRVSSACLHPLMLILDEPNTTAFTLAQSMGCSPSNITGLLDRLEHDGWINRDRNPYDRRSWLLTATPRAMAAFEPLTADAG